MKSLDPSAKSIPLDGIDSVTEREKYGGVLYRGRSRTVLILLCLLSMITYLDRVCFGVAAKDIAGELGLGSVADLKWAFTAFSIAYAIFEIPTGWLGDKFGPKAMLIRIVLWWSLFTALTGLVGLKVAGWTFGGLGTLILIRFLFGAGEAGAYPNIAKAIYNWFPEERWERAQGFIWMSGRLMGGLTPLLWMVLVTGTSATSPLMQWRGAFLLFGALGIVWCLAFRFLFSNRPNVHPPEHQGIIRNTSEAVEQARTIDESKSVPWKWLFTNRNLLLVCLAYSFVNYGWGFNITYFPAYLTQRFGDELPPTWMAIYAGSPLWFGAVGCFLGSSWVDWIDQKLKDRRSARRWACIGAMFGCAVAWALAASTSNVHIFCWSVAGAAFFVDLTLGATWATCQDIGGEHTAVAAGFMNTIGTVGAAFAGWLTGTIVQQSIAHEASQLGVSVANLPLAQQNTAAEVGFQMVFLTYMGIYLLAAGCWYFVKPTRYSTRTTSK